MKTVFLFFFSLFFGVSAWAETFTAPAGASITATKSGNDVTIQVTGMPGATTLMHFQYQGIKEVPLSKDGIAVLKNVADNGGRFQIFDETSRKWLLITPKGNTFGMKGLVQECTKSKKGCALETKV